MIFGQRAKTVVVENGYEKKIVIKGRDAVVSQCTRKTKIATKAAAEDKAKLASKQSGKDIRAYLCNICSRWHIGEYNHIKEVELPMHIAGRQFMAELQGMAIIKIKDDGWSYIFTVPHSIEENEYKILDLGILIAYKAHKGIYRDKNGEKEEHYREFNNLHTMVVRDRVYFLKKIELHKENMESFEDARNHSINGLPFTSINLRAGEIDNQPIAPPPAPKVQDTLPVTDPKQVDIYLGRAVFWTIDGRPYHREYRKCCIEGCKEEIELRSYITRNPKGELVGVLNKAPVGEGVKRRGSGRKKEEWLCASCADPKKQHGFEEVQAASVGIPVQQITQDHIVEQHEMVQEQKEQMREPQFNLIHIDEQVLRTLRRVAEDTENFSAEFVRGAALMAADLLISGE